MKTTKVELLTVLIVAALVILVTTFVTSPYWTSDIATFTVTGSERIVSGSEKSGIESKWIVLTETETFENTDTWMYFKFNSSDIQGRLKIGQTYTAKVYGWRIPFLSAYRNIVKINE